MLMDLTQAVTSFLKRPIVKHEVLSDFRIPPNLKTKLASELEGKGYHFNNFTSYVITEKVKGTESSNYALIPNQYFSFASEMYEFALELHKYLILFDKLRAYADRFVGSAKEIKAAIGLEPDIKQHFVSVGDIDLFAKFLDKSNAKYRLDAKRLINDKGKPRGARDCFASVILAGINLPNVSSSSFGNLVYDLTESLPLFKQVRDTYRIQIKLEPQEKAITQSSSVILPKPFILLAGISGTGKTRFVREQSKSTGSIEETYCLVSVRPDWHEPSDLLGYMSRLGQKGAEYVVTDVLKFLVNAWIETIELSDDEKYLSNRSLSNVRSFWLCLDEMNLAPVEQYFADYLSVLETREWLGVSDLQQYNEDNETDFEYMYSCDPVLKPDVFDQLSAHGESKLRQDLGLSESRYDIHWNAIRTKGVSIPFNLIVAGTVNMDETTHGFSRKVIDRAITFDFGAFFPNDFDQFLNQKTFPKSLSYPVLSSVYSDDLLDVEADPGGSKTISFLSSINSVLRDTPFELAYRALSELLISVVCLNPENDAQLQAIWDDFLMCKVLPRVDGDADKLRAISSVGSPDIDSEQTLFDQLEICLISQFTSIWEGGRPDLLRFKIENSDPISIGCRSRKKLNWMRSRLNNNGFTSFWP